MDNTTLLLANYPKINQTALFEQIGGGEKFDIVTGYDISVDSHEVTLNIARDLIVGLLTYDEVFILGNNVIDLIQVWGTDYLKELLRRHCIRVIPDVDLNPVIRKEKGGKWEHGFFGYVNGCENLDSGSTTHFGGPFGHVESWLFKNGVNSAERNAFIYLLEENSVPLNSKTIASQIIHETKRDLVSLDFLTDREFYRIINGRAEYNMLSNLRLHHLNMLSVIAAELRMDGMRVDGAINKLMLKKSTSVLSHPIPDGVEALSCIHQQKGFPDLGQLFVDKVIGLDEIIKLRDSFQGKMFRFWAKHDEYEENQMRQDVMNSVHSILGSRMGTALRMIACNLVGVTGFIPGLVASATDSYVVNKILNGWHPNLFLDDKLKRMLDDRIEENKKAREIEEREARFKGVGRNDLCPCGSGLKYKRCHGK